MKKRTISAIAGRLLAVFFIIMISFTVISRAAASVTVPLVTVSKPGKQALFNEIKGGGTIKSSGSSFMNTAEGFIVKQIFVEKGDRVEQGQKLFMYDINSLTKKCEELKESVLKAENELERLELEHTRTGTISDTETEKKAVARAKEAILEAENVLNRAIENWRNEALKKSSEALKKCNEAATDNTEQILIERAIVDAETECARAQKEYDEIEEDRIGLKQLMTNYSKLLKAQKSIVATLTPVPTVIPTSTPTPTPTPVLLPVNTPEDIIINSIISQTQPQLSLLEPDEEENLSGTDSDIRRAMDNILGSIAEKYYKEEYQSHKKDIEAALLAIDRAKESKKAVQQTWKYNIAEAYMSFINFAGAGKDYYTAVNEYQSQILSMNSAIAEADRNIADAEEELKYARKTEQEIADLIADGSFDKLYKKYLPDIESAESTLRQAETKLERANEDMNRILKEAAENKEKTDSVNKEEYDECYSDYEASLLETIENETDEGYKRMDIVNARAAYKSALQSMVDAEDTLRYKKESISNEESNRSIDDRLDEITYNSVQQNHEKLVTELAKLEELILAEGIIYSERTGIISGVELTVGKAVTGVELISFADESCYVSAKVSKRDAANLSIGDKIMIKYKSGEPEIESVIKGIGIIDENDETEMTALLPTGTYVLNASVTFRITKSMGAFENCIPITALRSDDSGKDYILVTREKESTLGTELMAVRVNVEIAEKNGEYAAIEDADIKGEQVITGYSGTVEDGYVVRIRE